ncbi:MAG: ABC transporter permease [Lachnospiraceae bacterium]|nr:ABC transporter permease [Lachnospiraceae bacterium]
MAKYIFSEFDRSLRRRLAYIYFIGIFVLCIIANIAVVAFRTVYGTNEGTYAYNIIEYAAWSFIVPYLSCIIIEHIVFGSEYPDPHIKDGRTSGLGRSQIYLSKLITGIMLAFVYLVITFVVLVATTSLFQINDRELGAAALKSFCGKLCLALPLFLAGISFATMFLFCFKEKWKAYVGYFTLTLIIPRIILMLAKEPPGIGVFKFLRTYTISQCFMLIPYPSSPERSVALILGLGFIYAAIATVIGIIVYNRKDS